MTGNPCNCATCTKTCDSYHHSGDIGKREMTLQTSTYGCLSHSNAREFMMNDIIMEYERRLKDGELVVGLKPAISHMLNGFDNNNNGDKKVKTWGE